jgi:hypothetical protein
VSRQFRTVLLDTNLLLLWLVSLTDASLLVTFKRVDTFVEQDLTLLAKLLRGFSNLITTPHVLAEVSNFVDHAPLYRRNDLKLALLRFIEANQETYEAAVKLISYQEFQALGIADTGLLALSTYATVLTVDHHLWSRITAAGGSCINFSHARSQQILTK